MATETHIQWTNKTWNPTTGCTKISPGCANCYIERTPPMRMAGRKFVGGKIPLVLHEDRLDAPLHWRKPCTVFVNSMSDLFHEDVPDSFILQVFDTMRRCTWSGGQGCGSIGGNGHTFQVLTKRAKRMLSFMGRLRWTGEALVLDRAIPGQLGCMMKQIWLGVSVENRQHGLPRIDVLRKTPATVRFLSIEPLLEDLGFLDLTGIHWVIIGGESGPKSRPFDLGWAQSIIQQCQAANVPVFMKQFGENVHARNDAVSEWFDECGHLDCEAERPRFQGQSERIVGFHDKKAGDPAEWPAWARIRQFPFSKE